MHKAKQIGWKEPRSQEPDEQKYIKMQKQKCQTCQVKN